MNEIFFIDVSQDHRRTTITLGFFPLFDFRLKTEYTIEGSEVSDYSMTISAVSEIILELL